MLSNVADGDGGAIYCQSSSPSVVNCVITGNTARGAWGGGGVFCNQQSNAIFSHCTFVGNTASRDFAAGGGLYCANASSLTITNCTVAGNTAYYGGGICCSIVGDATITDSLIGGNTAWQDAGGFGCYSGSATIDNCTLAHNQAGRWGGTICGQSAVVMLSNSILWGDLPEEVHVSPGSPMVAYCDIGGGWAGPGNIDADPLFVDPNGADYHLSVGSPCIDAGDPAFVPSAGETDMDGQLRVGDGNADGVAIVDLGADEYASLPIGDMNCDGAVDFADINPFVLYESNLGAWLATFPGCDPRIGDINGDGTYGEGSFGDINPFVALLTGR